MRVKPMVLSVTACALFAAQTHANTETQSNFKLSGNIALVSSYINRGSTNEPENDSAALQSFLKLNYKNFYAAYFNSKLSYSFAEIQRDENLYQQAEEHILGQADPNMTEEQLQHAVDQEFQQLQQSAKKPSQFSYYENDFILGYENQYKDLKYDFSIKYFYYPDSRHTGGIEASAAFKYPLPNEYGRIGLNIDRSLNDVYFVNQGDTYMLLSYDKVLAPGYFLTLSTGLSYFTENGKYIKNSTEDFAVRHATIELAHAFDQEEHVMGWLQYVVGGKDRYSERQENLVIAGIAYNF